MVVKNEKKEWRGEEINKQDLWEWKKNMKKV